MRSIAVTALLALCLSTVPLVEASEIGMGVLMIWPSARSTALAGAMTGLADDPDATYFNPAGLAFQTAAKASLNYANWLPGLYQGMCYASTAGGAPIRPLFLRGHDLWVGGSLTYMNVGETDIVNERGEFLGRTNVWRGVAAVQAATLLTSGLGAGVSLKLAHSAHSWWDNVRMWSPEPTLGLERGGNATTVAIDIGLMYRPSARVSLGLAVANLGPHISYRPDDDEPYSADLPRVARLGLCWSPFDSRYMRLSVMPELTKVLVGMFYDTTGTKTLGRKLREEWKDVWKAVGIEATAFNILSLRMGYFEDLTNQRGGILLEKEGQTYHYGVWDVLTRKNLGRFERIGLCWGLGFGSDRLRFDLSSDAAIYDFPTSNWKFSLTATDIGKLVGTRR